MLSFVLPILALAIALTPVIVYARVAYQREVAEQLCDSEDRERPVSKAAEVGHPSVL